MKITNYLKYLFIFINTFCFSQNKKISDKENFSKEFFTNKNVYYKLKKYSVNDKILIIDPDEYLLKKEMIYNNNDLEIKVVPIKEEGYEFLIKKVVINENLSFVAMWNKDSVTALCFYPFLSEFTPGKWIVEEITTRSIK